MNTARRFILLVVGLAAWISAEDTTIAIIPQPVSILSTQGPGFIINATTTLHEIGEQAAQTAEKITHADNNNNTSSVGIQLAEHLSTLTGLTIKAPDHHDADGIVLSLSPSFAADTPGWAGDEAYRLVASSQRVTISASTAHGLFNGMQSLLQLATLDSGGRWIIPPVTINDQPRLRWRGLMLDCGRHFFSVPEIYRFIDLMAMHKLNIFHWHLTEDQGWRIEVKRYPKLMSVGAWRKDKDGEYGGFYSQEDLKAVVAYAASRFIDVIPEIEMPGHSIAAVASYPELGNDDIPGWVAPSVQTKFHDLNSNLPTFSPKEETFKFIAGVFDEILPLFPSAFVHIGGDEAQKGQWKKSPLAQKIIKDNKLKGEQGLQSWFIRRVEKLLNERGKRLIGWDEIQEGGLSPTATMMVWHDTKVAKTALDRGNNIIMASKTHTYFDYDQGNTPRGSAFKNIGRNLTLATVYSFEPVPPGTAPERLGQVLGCQGQVWGEHIGSTPKVEYMTWPRACALAEVAWSPATSKDYPAFQKRLTIHQTRLDRLHVNYRRDDGLPAQPQQSMERTPRPQKQP